MRHLRLFVVLMWLGVPPSVVALQVGSHFNKDETAVKAELKMPADVIVGNYILKAGTYIVACDRNIVTFTLKSTNEAILSLPCKGAMMKKASLETKGDFVKQPSGYIALDRLYLKGSNVEHVF